MKKLNLKREIYFSACHFATFNSLGLHRIIHV